MRKTDCIVFENVIKEYKDIKALDGVSFTITQGEVFGYIGPNGAGKTTTLKILVGLLENYQGNVRINDLDVSTNKATLRRVIIRGLRVGPKSQRKRPNHSIVRGSQPSTSGSCCSRLHEQTAYHVCLRRQARTARPCSKSS